MVYLANLFDNIFDLIIKPFTEICNLSFATGIFPNAMKIARVTPVYKKGPKLSTIIVQSMCFRIYQKFSRNFLKTDLSRTWQQKTF